MTTKVHILLVEDSLIDADLIAEAFEDAQFPHSLTSVQDGEAALQVLSQVAFPPHLVIMDLNLPKLSGVEVLKAMRSDPSLRTVPVIMLTNSQSQDDVLQCYANFCNAYIRKPIGFTDLAAAIKATGDFWFRTATLPLSFGNTIAVNINSK